MSSRSRRLVELAKSQCDKEELSVNKDNDSFSSSCTNSTTGFNGYYEYDPNDNPQVSDDNVSSPEDDSDKDPDYSENNNQNIERYKKWSHNEISLNSVDENMEWNKENTEEGNLQGNLVLDKDADYLKESVEINEFQGTEIKKQHRQKKRNTKVWKSSVRKRNRNQGIEYMTSGNKIRLQRFPKNINQPCNCNLKCHEKINDDMKSEIFKEFWKLGDLEKQRSFIIANVKRFLAKRNRKENSRRTFSQKYFLPYRKENYAVCQQFFLKSLDISEKMVRTALAKCDRHSISLCSPDQRGHHTPGIKLSKEVREAAEKHIDSFPRIPAHWCRKDSKKEYLEAILNKKKMYELYKLHCEENNIRPVSETIYREILIEKNIGFYVPRKDQCWCHHYEQLPEEEKEQQKNKYELHIKRKIAANEEKMRDGNIAKNDLSYCSANFDLEAVLYCPLFHAKPIFYKRKLANFNFTVYEVAIKKGHCYIWSEFEGKRGANEIASCLMKFIESLPNNVKHLSLFSDCCSGQNRNSIVACMLQQAVVKTDIEIIDLKFLEPGHTHMECDSMHATIETASEYAKIYLPNDWHNVIRLAKKDNNPYSVNVLSHSDFYDYKDLKENIYVYPNKTLSGQMLNWKKVRWLRFKKSESNLLFFKNEFWENDFHVVCPLKKRGRPGAKEAECKKAYQSVIPIDKKKYADLLSLCNCENNLVPKIYHDFYKSLPHSDESENMEDDLPLAALKAKLLKRKRKRN